jgi:hypothetical protein
MGKQFDKLVSEQLKQYYCENFEAYKNTKAVALDLISAKTQFTMELYGKLENEFQKKVMVGGEEGIIKRQIYQEESYKVFDETNHLKNEWKVEKEKVENSGGNVALNKIKVEVLEKKLEFIEEELNKRGIMIKIVKGEIEFEESMLKEK